MSNHTPIPSHLASPQSVTRAAIYARVSDKKKQGKNYSIPEQIAECQQDCGKHGHTVVEVFREKFTGVSTVRPERDKLRELARTKAIDVIVMLELDRLARTLADQLIIEEEFLQVYRVPMQFALAEYDD